MAMVEACLLAIEGAAVGALAVKCCSKAACMTVQPALPLPESWTTARSSNVHCLTKQMALILFLHYVSHFQRPILSAHML